MPFFRDRSASMSSDPVSPTASTPNLTPDSNLNLNDNAQLGATFTIPDFKPEDLIWFHSEFVGRMEMYAAADSIANYLDQHHSWFRRCAEPMTAEPIGENGYVLTIGRFGALGYYVIPKIGLELLPQQDRVYRIETIAIPGYVAPGYEVEFNAVQTLHELQPEPNTPHDLTITSVDWELDLKVGVYFPDFIRALPETLVSKTGHQLLVQIVKQVSKLLTRKVQEDFHATQSQDCLQRFRQFSRRRQSFFCESKQPIEPSVTNTNTDSNSDSITS